MFLRVRLVEKRVERRRYHGVFAFRWYPGGAGSGLVVSRSYGVWPEGLKKENMLSSKLHVVVVNGGGSAKQDTRESQNDGLVGRDPYIGA